MSVDKIIKELTKLKKTSIKIGVPTDVGAYPNGQSIAEVGATHELGIRVPRRSFLKDPIYDREDEIKKALESGFKSVLDGGSSDNMLTKVGITAQNISKGAFLSGGYGKWKDIDERTKRAKKSSKILVNDSKLLQSITHWIEVK